eukprot:SAG11_NODE_675_length_7800_cov_6.380730_1_plen_48_part_00
MRVSYLVITALPGTANHVCVIRAVRRDPRDNGTANPVFVPKSWVLSF